MLQLSGDVDNRDEIIADLEAEVESLKAQLAHEKQSGREGARAVAALRKQLTPLYQALQMVFGQMEAVGGSEPMAASSDARVSAVWQSWKSKFPGAGSKPPREIHAAPPPKAAPPLPAAIVGVPERPMPAAIEVQDWHLMMVVVDTDDRERRHLVQDALVKIGDVKRFGSTSTWFVSAPRSSIDVRENIQKMVGQGENVYVHDLRKSSGASLCCDTKFWEWIQKNYHND